MSQVMEKYHMGVLKLENICDILKTLTMEDNVLTAFHS